MKYKQTKEDLLDHFNDHINFIRSSCMLYDNGLYHESKRIATSLRVLFHNTRYSNSLLNQLNYADTFLLWSSAGLYTPSNLLTSWTLLSLRIDYNGIQYNPILNTNFQRSFYLNIDDWWNEIIFDDKMFFISRRDVILSVANQDGGAHVDPILNESYSNITKRNSLGYYQVSNAVKTSPINNPAYASIRQIAHEVLHSFYTFKRSFKRKAYPERKFEMRFVDEDKRFKWSTTDLTYSVETRNIVNKYRSESRKYYIDTFEDNIKREVILK